MKTAIALPICTCLLVTACSTLNIKTWPAATNEGEIVDLSKRAPEQGAKLDGWSFDPEDDVGLAFSGGGTVAASCAIGQLRALKAEGLLSRVKYVSTVSGGTWGVLPWIFLSPEEASRSRKSQLKGPVMTQGDLDDHYLGRYRDPSQLTIESLTEDPPKGSGLAMNTDTKFGVPLTFKGDENFAAMVGKTFLDPVGLDDEGRYFAWSKTYVRERMLGRSGNEKLDENDFYYPAPGRPFLIANSALLRRQRTNLGVKLLAWFSKGRYRKLPNGYWPVEMTPLYTGLASVTGADPVPGFVERDLGGGFIESPGFNYRFDQWDTLDPTRARVKSRHSLFARQHTAFSLADVLAASGSAPAAAISELSDLAGIQPEFYTWSMSRTDRKPSNGIFDVPFVDGGACDNTGAIQLMAHGVKKIIVFANSASLFPYDANLPPKLDPGDRDRVASISTLITSMFGVHGNENFRNELLANPKTNHVLDNRAGQSIHDIELAFWNATKAGRPLVYTADYTTVKCERFNVPAGRKVAITWVYPGAFDVRVKDADGLIRGINSPWLESLIKSVPKFKEEDFVKQNHLERFPGLSTFFSNGIKIQDLNNVQANALAHYHAYNLKTCLTEIRRKLRIN